MKLAYLHTAFTTWGGIERVWIEKMNYLASHFGHEVYMVTSDQGDHPIPYPLDNGIRHCDLDVRTYLQYKYRGFRRYREARRLSALYHERLKAFLLRECPDVLVCTSTQNVRQLRRVAAGIPIVVEDHLNFLYPSSFFHRVYTLYNNYWVGRADAVVVLTEGNARQWRRVCRNVHVIPNIVSLNTTGRYSDCTSRRAIFVGRIVAQKNLPALVAAWRLVHRRCPDWRLDIYGEGDMDSMPDIQLYVHAPTPDIHQRYMESSMLLLTSRYESFGLVIPEAMSCGVPAVSFDSPYGPASIITNGVDGFLVPLNDVQAFADHVLTLMEDNALRQRMGQACRQSAQRYQAGTIMQQWQSLFRSLLPG